MEVTMLIGQLVQDASKVHAVLEVILRHNEALRCLEGKGVRVSDLGNLAVAADIILDLLQKEPAKIFSLVKQPS